MFPYEEIQHVINSLNAPFVEMNGLKIQKLTGDASTKKFFRILCNAHSCILMQADQDIPLIKRFCAIHEIFEKANIRIPHIYKIFSSAIFLEDLGDTTLLAKACTTNAYQKYYFKSLHFLIQLRKFFKPEDWSHVENTHLFFDEKKLLAEVAFTNEHLQKLCGYSWPPHTLFTIEQSFLEICQRLQECIFTFCHRDYHSKNIMITKNQECAVIDYQDARIGPWCYDACSLLKDSYFQIQEKELQKYLRNFYDSLGLDEKILRQEFDWMSIQRNYKAIGSFASIYNIRKNPYYLKYIGATFETLKITLQRYPQYKAFRRALLNIYHF